jgi:hypothetical protein
VSSVGARLPRTGEGGSHMPVPVLILVALLCLGAGLALTYVTGHRES